MSWYLALTPVQALLVWFAVAFGLFAAWIVVSVLVVNVEAWRDSHRKPTRTRRHGERL